MTITELRAEVRNLVPASITTCVNLSVWDFNHINDSRNPEVSVRISAIGAHIECQQVEANTAEEALDLFKIKVLPELGLSEPRPALERLAELEGINAPV